jgi:hypothetical protein
MSNNLTQRELEVSRRSLSGFCDNMDVLFLGSGVLPQGFSFVAGIAMRVIDRAGKGLKMNWLRATLCAMSAAVISWTAWGQPGTPATSVVGYPGAGVIQAGDTWESFLPQCFGPNYSETATAATNGVRRMMQMGNFDRSWTTPSTHWPAAFPITPYWYKNVFGHVFDPDTTWNPSIISGHTN